MIRSIASFFLCLLFVASGSYCFAKTLSLYDQPKTDAKVVGSIDSDSGIIPIFTPKNSEWMKVGDPQNGNVGWIKIGELKGKTTEFSFTQRIISTGTQPQGYQVIQYGVPSNIQQLTPAQTKVLYDQIKAQQAISEHARQMLEEMWKNNGLNFPVIMPIVVAPVVQEPAKAGSSKAK